MARSKKVKTTLKDSVDSSMVPSKLPFLAIPAENSAVDPTLATLFASSAGPVRAPPKSRYKVSQRVESERNLARESVEPESSSDQQDLVESDSPLSLPAAPTPERSQKKKSLLVEEEEEEKKGGGKRPRKRKRSEQSDDLEGNYLHRLVKTESLDHQQRDALRAEEGAIDHSSDVSETSADEGGRTREAAPLHESLLPSKEQDEVEKSARTVFLANVSTLAITSKTARKTLIDHLTSFSAPVKPSNELGGRAKIESLRFRSTAFSSTAIPKKAAFARKELMNTTTKSTNAYAVYSDRATAQEATKKLNGSVVLDRHLRVDLVDRPASTDHRRCVFVGNLGFVDDDSLIKAGEKEVSGAKARKSSTRPGDVEEGLWRQFGKAGHVENVRVVRDPKTRVGKGIAYVQFADANAVEAALLFNDQKFPPLLPRRLRVTRSKATPATSSASNRTSRVKSVGNFARTLVSKTTVAAKGDRGKSGTRPDAPSVQTKGGISSIAKTPEMVVFEGHRASSKSGRSGLKSGGSGRKRAKPKTRSSQRGTAWKAAGHRR